MENPDNKIIAPEAENSREEHENPALMRNYKPEKPKSKTPILYVPSWGSDADAYDAVLKRFQADGRNAKAPENLYGVDGKVLADFLVKLEAAHPGMDIDKIKNDYPETELRKVAALFAGLDQKKEDGEDNETDGKVDCVGVSQGGYITVIAATLWPERFRNLVLVDTVGIVGKHSRAELMARTAHNVITEETKARQEKTESAKLARDNLDIGAKSMQKVVLGNFKEAMIDDTGAISEADITKMLIDLRKLGIKIAIIHGVDDKIFPMQKVFDQKRETGEGDEAKIISGPNAHLNSKTADIFLSVKGTHNQMGLYLDLWMEMAEFALDKLETMPKDRTIERDKKAREFIERANDLLDDPIKNYDRAVILAKGAEMLVYGIDGERKKNGNFDKELAKDLDDLNAKLFAVKS